MMVTKAPRDARFLRDYTSLRLRQETLTMTDTALTLVMPVAITLTLIFKKINEEVNGIELH